MPQMKARKMKLVTGNNPNDAWRLSLPKDGCRHLGWTPGDTLLVSVSHDGMKVKKEV